MKKFLNITYVLLGAMIILNSCHREDFPSHQIPTESDCPIEFSPISASLETKTDASATIEDFKVWASNKVNNVDNYNVFGSEGTDVRKSGSDWVYSPVRYWQPSNYNFYAVSPIEISSSIPISGSLSSSGLSIYFGEKVDGSYSGWDLSSNQVDLLLASEQNVTTRLNATNTPVDLAFDHLLSKITFTAKNVEEDNVSITVTGIEIRGCHTKSIGMTYNQEDTWTFPATTSGAHSLPAFSQAITKTEYTDIGSSILVFPQECKTLRVELTFNDTHNGVTTTGNVKSAIIQTNWDAGKQYNYKINVSFDSISFGDITVDEWADGQIINSEDF